MQDGRDYIRDMIGYAPEDNGSKGLFGKGNDIGEVGQPISSGELSDVELGHVDFGPDQARAIISAALKISDNGGGLDYFITECRKWLVIDSKGVKGAIGNEIKAELDRLSQVKNKNDEVSARVKLLQAMETIIKGL